MIKNISQRRWREKNKDKYDGYMKHYRETHRDYYRTKHKLYYYKNRDLEISNRQKWRIENLEKDKNTFKRYYDKNSFRYKQKQKEWRDKLKLEVYTYYSGGLPCCNNCGDDRFECLTIDHINGAGRKHSREIRKNICSWLRGNNYPDGYQILCWNCNCVKGHFGKYPEKRKCVNCGMEVV